MVNDLDAAPGDAVAAEIKAAGGQALPSTAACRGGFADRFVGAALSNFEGLDIIVNNAGYTWDSTIQKMTDEQFQAMLDVHLVAPFRILRAAAEPIRVMAKKEADAGREVFRKVVNISSSPASTAMPGSELFLRKGLAGGADAHAVQGVGALQGQRQLCPPSPDQHRLNPADRDPAETIDVAAATSRSACSRRCWRHGPDDTARRGGTPEEAADAVYLFCSPNRTTSVVR